MVQAVFKEADKGGHEALDRDEIRDLLIQMGNPLALSKVDSYIKKMTGSKARGTVVTLEQFKIYCAKKQPTAVTSLMIFFCQSMVRKF